MKRATFITWEQLKVGITIVIALAILMVAVYRLGRAANLFTERYELIALLPSAPGLREGGSVAVAGQIVGSVTGIEFLEPDQDTTRNLVVTMEIDRTIMEQVRENSSARLRTLGLLGDKIIDISPGTPVASVLEPGDTIPVSSALDYEAVLAQAAGAVDDVVGLTRDLREITGTIVRGEGTVGQLLTNRTLYDELTSTITRTNALLSRLQTRDGTLGRLIDDPTLYTRLTSSLASLDTILVRVNAEEGTIGRLLSDTTLYRNLVGITTSADSLLTMMATGEGTMNKLLTDQELYDQLLRLTTDLNAILGDVRQNPQRYFKGMIEVF